MARMLTQETGRPYRFRNQTVTPIRSRERSSMTIRMAAALGLAAALFALPAAAQQKMSIALNWVAGGDHAPIYYAQRAGWYKDAGIDLDIEQGRGSAASAQRVGAGSSPLGIADMAVVLNARGKGAELVAVMNIYANS